MNEKPISIQCLNIDCPRCKAIITYQCRNDFVFMDEPHQERVRAMKNLIEESRGDKTVRRILRERNFAR